MLLIELLHLFSPHGPLWSLRIMFFKEQNEVQRITMETSYIKI